MNATPSASLSYTLDEHWLRVPALVLGPVPTGQGTPHCHVCVDTGQDSFRIDVYADPDHYCFREEVKVVESTLFIGIGHQLITVGLTARTVCQHALDCYFGYLYEIPDGVLAASGCSLYRVGLDGSLRWASANLAVDGLLVREVHNGLIVGDAENDPPGGWEPFCVSLESGEACKE